MATQSRTTLSAVAAAAGVSVPTVSKVVNGRSDVAPLTRERVEDLLRQHQYQPRVSRTRRPTNLIDLVFTNLGSSWAMEILAGAEEVAHRGGAGVVVSSVHGRVDARSHRGWLDRLAARRSDGLLLIGSQLTAEQHALLRQLSIPVVVVDPAGQPPPGIPSVGATNWAGGLAATEHLIGLGHERIAIIGGPPDVLCSQARVDGGRTALRAAGLKLRPGYVRSGDFLSPTGYRETVALLDLPQPPTALFACSDQMAFGAYEALYERGLRTPDDISVIGFDDLDAARWAVPPLTTVRQPLIEMAGMATRMLLTLVGGEVLESPRVELATPLVVRASTGPPGAA